MRETRSLTNSRRSPCPSVTGFPFSFTALLGLLSLSGILTKNGTVLVEEIGIIRSEECALRDAAALPADDYGRRTQDNSAAMGRRVAQSRGGLASDHHGA